MNPLADQGSDQRAMVGGTNPKEQTVTKTLSHAMGQVTLDAEFQYCIFLTVFLQSIVTPVTTACVES